MNLSTTPWEHNPWMQARVVGTTHTTFPMACLESSSAGQSENTAMATADCSNPSSPDKGAARNLSQAFEALCATDTNADALTSPQQSKAVAMLISPTGVTELSFSEDEFPTLCLHPSLKRELSDHLVQRISEYSIIHDVNKEAQKMSQHDPAGPSPACEEESPIVLAATGKSIEFEEKKTEPVMNAMIDEEEWLLSSIAARSPEETLKVSVCPPTFLQAMGEKDYENPITSVTGHARTQLWKPSRSWWEAKSGKNPWIEPNSHNKRWRYLWPLIYYHKFLAKCIKKLKRNGIDVKLSISPVSVFLREEVCAVSDHLASVSLFDSDEWMECLRHFEGWILLSEAAEHSYKSFVMKLKLRPLNEPGDVDSPLLRSQIDEHFLRSMAAIREELKEPSADRESSAKLNPKDSIISGHPPMYPRLSAQVPKQIHGVRRPRYCPPTWYGWEHPHGYGDGSSVHSGLSADSYGQFPYEYGMYAIHPYYGAPASYPPSDHSNASGYSMEAVYGNPAEWGQAHYALPHPAPMECLHPPPSPDQLPMQANEPVETTAEHQTPCKPDLNSSYMSHSPYWSHLDQATLSMGLATPARATPSTPPRNKDSSSDASNEDVFASAAQPLLLRHHYYGYTPYGAMEGYGPPSPATQFMMSPQASFAYNYGYGVSPHRSASKSTPRARRTPQAAKSQTTQSAEDALSAPLTSPPPVRKALQSTDRESPSTVDTTAETDSMLGAAH